MVSPKHGKKWQCARLPPAPLVRSVALGKVFATVPSRAVASWTDSGPAPAIHRISQTIKSVDGRGRGCFDCCT
jgi:hypothetical protein